jgi:hypothetical protein
MRHFLVAGVCVASVAVADPNPDPRVRAGVNHHLGDDSFVARFGRAPTRADDEHVRMQAQLAYVRAWLGSRSATRPELADRRAELLRFLDDYIARGVTPRNTHLPWRTPVFIDDAGAICAVGYLIERSVGRALPERIAAEHRFDLLEDIAAAMPEVDGWIRSSGFTLDELASIQPAYQSPNVEAWRTWDLVKHPPHDGPFDRDNVAGRFARHAMQGSWTVRDERGVVVGAGDLVDGAGTWRGFYSDGKRVLAEGPYVHNVAHGLWRFFHANGTLAATGRFDRGVRTGNWRFYTATTDHKLIAAGAFGGDGAVVGVWDHYDAEGKPVARTWSEGGGERIDVVPAADGIVRQRHELDLGNAVEWSVYSLERLAWGSDQIYVHTTNAGIGGSPDAIIYDAMGFRVTRGSGGWTAADCHWPAKRVAIARAGDVSWLNQVLTADAQRRGGAEKVRFPVDLDLAAPCDAPRPVGEARAHVLDKLVAARDALKAKPPTFVRDLVLGEDKTTVFMSKLSVRDGDDADLLRMLADFTIHYLEWPHIDGQFERVFATMPGRWHWDWAGGTVRNVPGRDPADE